MSYSFVLVFVSFALAYAANPTTHSPIVSSTTEPTQPPIPPSTSGPQLHNVNLSLTNGTDGFECARVTGTFQLSINYKNKSDADLTNMLYIDQSVGLLKVTGSCGATGALEQTLVVDFYNGWKFAFAFTRSSADEEAKYSTKNLTLVYQVDSNHSFINASTSGSVFAAYAESDLFNAKYSTSYLCNAKKTLQFNDSATTLTVTDLRLQAFKSNWAPGFQGDLSECLADNASDSNLVPIIVGVCLAALVIVILVAYFIGRWRTSRSSAYQPV